MNPNTPENVPTSNHHIFVYFFLGATLLINTISE